MGRDAGRSGSVQLRGFERRRCARYAKSLELLPGDGRRRPSDSRQHAGGSCCGGGAHRVRGRHGLDAGGSRGPRGTARRHGRRGRALGHIGRRHDQRDLAMYDELYGNGGDDFSPEARGKTSTTSPRATATTRWTTSTPTGRPMPSISRTRPRPTWLLSRNGSDLVFTAGADSVALAGWYSRHEPQDRLDLLRGGRRATGTRR